MSLKTKVTSLITTFILLCSLLTVGVFAVKNTTFNVGGDIVFQANGINANIKLTDNGLQGASLPDGVVAGTHVMNEIVLNDTKSKEDVENQFSKWSDLDLTFGESGVATIELSITNNSTTDYIDVILSIEEGTSQNIKITAKNNDGSIQSLVYPSTTETYTITFTVQDDEYSASAEGFTIDFGLQKKTIDDIPSYDAVEGLTIECNTTDKIASITGNSITSENSDAVIPAYVKSGDVVCAVTSIANNAFFGSSITSVQFPKTLTTIGGYAFDSSSLTGDLIIPEGVTSIGDSALEFCYELTSVEFADTIVNMGDAMFTLCSNLKSVKMPKYLTTVPAYTFGNCSNLTTVILPENITSIGHYAFNCCTKLVLSEIPEGVTNIGAYAFSSCQAISNITIPNSVSTISSMSFGGCTSLSSITLGAGVTSIDSDAFAGCNSLVTINYRGTEEQWNAITIGSNNDPLSTATINYNYAG